MKSYGRHCVRRKMYLSPQLVVYHIGDFCHPHLPCKFLFVGNIFLEYHDVSGDLFGHALSTRVCNQALYC